MSLNGSVTTIEFKPRPSVLLSRILLAAHGLAAFVVFSTVHHKFAMPVLLLVIGYSYYSSYRKHVLHKGSGATRRIIWQADGAWFLEDEQGVMREAQLQPSSFVHPRLVILGFRFVRSKGRRSLVLCPDSMDVDTLRRIRARLRTGRPMGKTEEADPSKA